VLPGGRVLALDVDPIELPKTEARLRATGIPPDALLIRRTNFAGLARVLAADDLPAADVVLADLGVSSMQIDDPSRGFSFKRTGPLDLRMNPQRGQPAARLLASVDAPTLARLLDANADQPDAAALAQAIVERQQRAPLTTTTALAETVADACASRRADRGVIGADDAIRRVFQALRIAVNDEFGALDAFLRLLPGCVAPGGRVAMLTFHSGEDRRVKQAFKEGLRSGAFARIAEEVVRPGAAERRANPRSSAAKLRWAVRT
jgi:16S rRNA (cytosine1402-N4)-methyltransferase